MKSKATIVTSEILDRLLKKGKISKLEMKNDFNLSNFQVKVIINAIRKTLVISKEEYRLLFYRKDDESYFLIS